MRSWIPAFLALVACLAPSSSHSGPPGVNVSLPHFHEAVEEALRADDRRVALYRSGLEQQDIRSYAIDVCVDPERSWFDVVATVEVACSREGVRFAVHPSLTILTVKVSGGDDPAYSIDGGVLSVAVGPTEDTAPVTLTIHGQGCARGEGLWTGAHCVFLSGKANWYPAPLGRDTALFRVVVRNPPECTAVCTGLRVGMAASVADRGPACVNGDTWATMCEVASVDVIVGRLEETVGFVDGITISSYRTPSASEDAGPGSGTDLAGTAMILELVQFLESCYGEYPYGWLNVVTLEAVRAGLPMSASGPGFVFVSDGGAGTPRSHPLRRDRYVFELSHSWWPHAVDAGCVVSDGLAGSAQIRWLETIGDDEEASRRRLQRQAEYVRALYDSSGAAPLSKCLGPTASRDRRVSGGKGTVVFAILTELLGYDVLCASVRGAAASADGDVMSFRHLSRALERESDSDLDWFLYEWIHRGGVPTYALTYETERIGEGTFVVRGTIEQEGEPYRTPVPVTVDLGGWSYEEWVPIESTSQAFEFETEEEALLVTIDGRNLIPDIGREERARLHHDRGVAARAANEWGLAVDEFGAAAGLMPAKAPYQFDYGEALVRSGRPGDGLPVLEEAIRLAPENGSYRLWIGRVYSGTGELERALGHLSAYVGARPDDPIGFCERALVLVALARLEEARADIESARGLMDDHGGPPSDRERLLLAEGALNEATGDTAAAVVAYEAALAVNPVSDPARSALRRLAPEGGGDSGTR